MTELRDAKILVTGASGFIGAHLCHALRRLGAQVLPLTHHDPPLASPECRSHVVDLRDREAIRVIVNREAPDFVVHLAAYFARSAGLASFCRSYETNLLATCHLAEAVIERAGCQRFVYLGSAEEYGRVSTPFDVCAREAPRTAYGLSKLAATQLLQALDATYGLPVATLRATIVYGPEQRPRMLVPALVQALVTGQRFEMTEGYQTRDFVYVDDVVDALVCALEWTGSHDRALHVSSGQPVAVRDVALLAARLVGDGAASLIDFGAIRSRTTEARDYWADNAETRAVLGWAPRVPLEEGLRRTIAHIRAARPGV